MNIMGGDGFENFYYSAEGKKLCQAIEKEVKAIGQNSRGVKQRKALMVLKWTNMVACLNEGAFIDNKNDIKDFDSDAELKKLAEAYGKGIVNYLKLTKTSLKEEKVSNEIIILETTIGRLEQELNTNKSELSNLKKEISKYDGFKEFKAPNKAKYSINLDKNEIIYYKD